jgi:isoleucyl-tRNA synthetase
MAPVTPFLTEMMYQNLIRPAEQEAPMSVHLCSYPRIQEDMVDNELMEEMDLAMRASSLGRAAKSKNNIKLRQPLSEAVLVADEETMKKLARHRELIAEELNVKHVRMTSSANELQSYGLKPVRRLLGRKHGRNLMKVVEAIGGLPERHVSMLAGGSSVVIMLDGVDIEILPEEVEVETISIEGYSVMEELGLTVGINTEITLDLRREGLARDLVRRIQEMRKNADFKIDDHIRSWYQGDDEVETVFSVHRDYITAETLSDSIEKGEAAGDAYVEEFDIDGYMVKISVVKI